MGALAARAAAAEVPEAIGAVRNPAERLEVRTIAHGSPAYEAEVELRSAILRTPLGLSFSAGELAAETDSRHLGCFVGGELVGCLVLRPIDAGRVQMRQVAVAEAARGAGIGRRLVAHAEALARDLGFREIVAHARETAVPFYERLGYAKVGERFTEVTLPHWVMKRAL